MFVKFKIIIHKKTMKKTITMLMAIMFALSLPFNAFAIEQCAEGYHVESSEEVTTTCETVCTGRVWGWCYNWDEVCTDTTTVTDECVIDDVEESDDEDEATSTDDVATSTDDEISTSTDDEVVVEKKNSARVMFNEITSRNYGAEMFNGSLIVHWMSNFFTTGGMELEDESGYVEHYTYNQLHTYHVIAVDNLAPGEYKVRPFSIFNGYHKLYGQELTVTVK